MALRGYTAVTDADRLRLLRTKWVEWHSPYVSLGTYGVEVAEWLVEAEACVRTMYMGASLTQAEQEACRDAFLGSEEERAAFRAFVYLTRPPREVSSTPEAAAWHALRLSYLRGVAARTVAP